MVTLATMLLVSAAATSYWVLLAPTPGDSNSHGQWRAANALRQLRTSALGWYCDRVSNRTMEMYAALGAAMGDAAPKRCRCDCDAAVDGCVRCSNCEAAPPPFSAGGVTSAGRRTSNSDADSLESLGEALRSRFTDVTCYLHGDETEMCAYDHLLCYDGMFVVLTVPVPPAVVRKAATYTGEVLGDPTGSCFDYRYYEPSSIEFTNCKYDLFRFNRIARPVAKPRGPAVPKGASPSTTPSASPSADVRVNHPSVDWPLPLTHRRWGPLNRGGVRFREITDTAIFGARPAGVEVMPDGAVVMDGAAAMRSSAASGTIGGFSPGTFYKGYKRGDDHVMANLSRAGFTIESVTRVSGSPYTVYWLDGPLWVMAMDAQFDRHIYHASTRLFGLYHAQRQNRSGFGDSEGDGYLPPLTAANHPIEGALLGTFKSRSITE